MKAKNYVVWSSDSDLLARLNDEYKYLGRECKVYDDRLVVFALAKSKKAKKEEARPERFSKREKEYGYARD